MAYDPANNTNTEFFASGDTLGSDTTTHDWYGYSLDGIESFSPSFGTTSWTVADISPRAPTAGVTADFWLDTDITAATPTRAWLTLIDGSAFLNLGQSAASGSEIELELGKAEVRDMSKLKSIASSNNMTIVPEPASAAAFFGLAAAGWLCLRRRRSF